MSFPFPPPLDAGLPLGPPPLPGMEFLPPPPPPEDELPPELLAMLMLAEEEAALPSPRKTKRRRGKRGKRLSPPQGPMEPVASQLAEFPSPTVQLPLEPAMDPGAHPKAPKAPTMGWVRNQSQFTVDAWRQRDTRMDEDAKLFALDRNLWEGEGELILGSLPYAYVEKAATLIGKQRPRIIIRSPRVELVEEAQTIKQYLRHKTMRWDEEWTQTGHNSLRRDIAHYVALRGWAAVRVWYDDGEGDDPALVNDPVRARPYDPRYVYPCFGSRGLRYVVHKYETTLAELLDEWPEAESLYEDGTRKEGYSLNLDDTVELWAYYDAHYHAVWTDAGEVKAPTAHHYGFVPWVIKTGYGSPIRPTRKDGSVGYGDVGLSIFHGARDSYLNRCKILSQLADTVASASNPADILYTDPTSTEPKPIDKTPGKTNYLLYGKENYDVIRTSPNPSDVGPLLAALQQDIDMAGLNPALFGAGPQLSGFAHSLMTDAAEDTLFPLMEAVRGALKLTYQYTLRLIRDFHEGPVGYFVYSAQQGAYVAGAATLDPNLLHQVGCEVDVTFDQVSPRDRAMMTQLAVQLTSSKLLSMRTVRETYLNVDDPDREDELVIAEMAKMDEAVMKSLIRMAVERMNNPEFTRIYEESQAPPPQPPMPPGGAPPGGPPPELAAMLGGGGAPPMPGMEPPGLPPNVMPPIQQSAMVDPLAMLMQSAGSASGGASAGPLPPFLG